MNEAWLRNQLEELADKLGLAVRYEKIQAEESSYPGGLCHLQGKPVIIIDDQIPERMKVEVLIEALRRFPTGAIYVKPVVRELLEGREV
jgi:hypothetical protein